jgi:hypothetical protein
MTNLLKELLHTYGLLYITVVQLEQQRPGTKHESLKEYYDSLGVAEPGEPVAVVRISKDGDHHILYDVDATSMPIDERYRKAGLTVLEMPEDEYYFFEAFRPGMFDLEKELPSFIFGMAVVYACALFESYVAELIRLRLKAHPAQIGTDKTTSMAEILKSDSKDDLIEMIIDRELNRIMHEPIAAILDKLRTRLASGH